MKMNTCKKCGCAIGEARFCPNCGEKNESLSAVEAEVRQRPQFCAKCGQSLGDSHFCPGCGQKVEGNMPLTVDNSQNIASDLHAAAEEITHKNLSCPHCGSRNLQYIVEQNVHTQGKDFSLGKGCLGYILLGGPLGLLCGLCGQKKTAVSTSKSQWICKECGTKFQEPEERRKEMKQQIVQMILTFVTGRLMSAGFCLIRYAPAFMRIRELGQIMNVIIVAVEIVFALALFADVIKLIQILKKPVAK